jgi:hypothetical protein
MRVTIASHARFSSDLNIFDTKNWDGSSQGRLTAFSHKAIPENGAI